MIENGCIMQYLPANPFASKLLVTFSKESFFANGGNLTLNVKTHGRFPEAAGVYRLGEGSLNDCVMQ